MRVVLAPVGSRGDVQPMIALARALKARGHEPFFAITRDFAQVIEKEGFPFRAADLDAQAVATEMGSRVNNPFLFITKIRELLSTVAEEAYQAAEGADIVVGAGIQLLASSVCEARGIPYLATVYAPTMVPSTEHTPIAVTWQGLPPWMNRVTWAVTRGLINLVMLPTLNRARVQLGLPRVKDTWSLMVDSHHTLGAFDGQLASAVPPDRRMTATGFFFLEDNSPLDAATEAFLEAGPRPVYIGFGSMPSTRPRELSEMVMKAIQLAGVRAVLGAGWSGLGTHGPVPDNVHVVKQVNHAALFPRLAGVVHHGGAGTISTAAKSGVPQMVVPHLMDQYYWGHRARVLGLGPAPVPIHRMSAPRLARVLTELTTEKSYREAAARMEVSLRGSNGPQRAVDIIESVAQQHRATPR